MILRKEIDSYNLHIEEIKKYANEHDLLKGKYFARYYINEGEIYNNVINLFKETWDGTKLRNIGVRLANFSKSMNVQTNIFDIKEKEDKPIDIILDKIVEKYGDNSITLASLTKKEK